MRLKKSLYYFSIRLYNAIFLLVLATKGDSLKVYFSEKMKNLSSILLRDLVYGQNVSVAKRIGSKTYQWQNISAAKGIVAARRISNKMHQWENVWLNISAAKHIGFNLYQLQNF